MTNNLVEHRETTHVDIQSALKNCTATPHLRLNVLATSEEATVAALRAAAGLAANLRGQITLIAAEAVPWQFPLKKPPVAVTLLEQKLSRLVYQAGIVGDEVRIQLCLCRDERQALRRALRPHSLIVLGQPDHCWSRRERNLKKFLTGLGHEVIFARLDESNQLDHNPTPPWTISLRKSFHNVAQHLDLRRG